MKKKILIVGGCGYIGGYLTDLLKKDVNNKVTIYDNLMYESRFFKDISFIRGDVRDTKKLESIIHNYDIVVWLAAIVGDGACAANIKLTQEVNDDSVKWLAKTFKGKIIFMSTCSVYGINNNLIDESAEMNPQSEYAASKIRAEQHIKSSSSNYLIFRLGTLFGMGDKYSRPRLDLVVNILTKRAVEGETLNVFGGEQWRPLLHVKDVGNAIKYGIDNKINGLYNISMNNYTIEDIAKEIKKIIPSSNIEYKNIPFEDLRNYRVKNEKFNNLGWAPEFTLKQGINEIKLIISDNRIVEPDNDIYSNAKYVRHKYV
jgi:nucleoside-diphosphate-sugar epimerase